MDGHEYGYLIKVMILVQLSQIHAYLRSFTIFVTCMKLLETSSTLTALATRDMERMAEISIQKYVHV